MISAAGNANASVPIFEGPCPGSSCPYTPPTPIEQGFIQNILARMNLERAQPQRDYLLNGRTTPLQPLTLDPALTRTDQAAAEYVASTGILQHYGGPDPGGEIVVGQDVTGPVSDSAGADGAFMGSPGHAVGYLSAAFTIVGIGVAIDSHGGVWVLEDFGNPDETSFEAGQVRIDAELASNSVFAQSHGTITTVQEPAYAGGGTDDARFVFPTTPIAAASPTATGVDWTVSGPVFAPGTVPVSPLPGPVTAITPSSTGRGYLLANAGGAISTHGDARFLGAANGLSLAAPVIGLRTTPDGGGYWELGADGGVFTFGDAGFFGSTGGRRLNLPVVGLASSASGRGYWLSAADGGVFTFGDAPFKDSLPGIGVRVSNIVGLVPTASGRGYWMIGADGGVFSFGGAPFLGSLPGIGVHIDDIVGLAPTPDDRGYWLVGRDGGVFAFGDAHFAGSLPAVGIRADNVVGIAAPPQENGYWLVGSDGGVFSFGVPFYGAD